MAAYDSNTERVLRSVPHVDTEGDAYYRSPKWESQIAPENKSRDSSQPRPARAAYSVQNDSLDSLDPAVVNGPLDDDGSYGLADPLLDQNAPGPAPASSPAPLDSGMGPTKLPIAAPDGIVTLNVGGTRFQTHIRSLRKHKSFFSAMFSGKFCLQPSSDGTYFIDRNPRYFEKILDYFRKAETNILGLSTRELMEFRDECMFYQVMELYHFLDKRVAEIIRPPRNIDWIDTSGPVGGIRHIEQTNLAFVVSKEFHWDMKRDFDPPPGYKWATCFEYLMEVERRSLILENRHDYVHMDVGGWNRYRWHYMYNVVFAFKDTPKNFRVVHCGMRLRSRAKTVVSLLEQGGIVLRTGDGEERFRVGFDPNDLMKGIWQGFAGIVCLKVSSPSDMRM